MAGRLSLFPHLFLFTLLIKQFSIIRNFKMRVVDEIHHHPVSDSPSVLSLPAPVDVVDSFPLKNHKKADATVNGAQEVYLVYVNLAKNKTMWKKKKKKKEKRKYASYRFGLFIRKCCLHEGI